MKHLRIAVTLLFVLFVAASLSAQPREIPETSAEGTVDIDGKLWDSAWSQALEIELKYDNTHEQPGWSPYWVYDDPKGEDDFSGKAYVMRQGQKFYIATDVTDNQLLGTFVPVAEGVFTLTEFSSMYSPEGVWNMQAWNADGLEVFLNLLQGPPEDGTVPKYEGPAGNGYMQLKVTLDKKILPENKPTGGRDYYWDMASAESGVGSINDFAWGKTDFSVEGTKHIVELCIDAEQVEGLTLEGGASIAMIVHYRDADLNQNASVEGIEDIPNGSSAPMNNTRFWNLDMNFYDLYGGNEKKSAGDWEEFVLAENTTDVAANSPVVANSFDLSQNYPNPFNPVTNITYSLEKEGEVTLQIFDVTGKLVETLVKGNMAAGIHTISWNAADLGSGIYFYKLNSDGQTLMKKMTLLK